MYKVYKNADVNAKHDFVTLYYSSLETLLDSALEAFMHGALTSDELKYIKSEATNGYAATSKDPDSMGEIRFTCYVHASYNKEVI